MNHSKTDSEATSIAASSPTRSPQRTRPVYYVQSPSHDGEKTATSFHSTPAITPMGSPPHSSTVHHSRESSTSRFSGPRKITPNETARNGYKTGHIHWKESNVIEEEGLLDDERRQNGWPRKYYVLAFIVGFFILFGLFSLILYGAAKPQKPRIAIKSITFERFMVQAGSDNTGVATDMISVNSSLKFTYRNTGTFFGTHVTSTPIELSYSRLKIATGIMKKFHQSRKSHRTVGVMVIGNRIPLYGSGAGLDSPKGLPTLPVPLKLGFKIRSRAYVLGRLVKPKFYKSVECNITFDPLKLNKALSLKHNCTYT